MNQVGVLIHGEVKKCGNDIFFLFRRIGQPLNGIPLSVLAVGAADQIEDRAACRKAGRLNVYKKHPGQGNFPFQGIG